MKKINFIWIFVLLYNTNGFLLPLIMGLLPGPECITFTQLIRVTKTLCHEQRHNQTLWDQVIECHRPMSDEFMRSSGEALCPNPKYVQDPTDETYSIEDVFFNICGVIDGSLLQSIGTGICIAFGTDTIPSHDVELKELKERWGKDLPCNIGKCVKNMGLSLGT